QMRRILVSMWLVMLPLGLTAPPSFAAGDCKNEKVCASVDAVGTDALAITALGQEEQKRPTSRRDHLPSRGSVTTFILDPRVIVGVDGSPCVYIGQTPGDPASPQEVDNETKALRLLARYPLCVGSPRPPAKPTPGAAAAEAFRQITNLPKPSFSVPPGYTIA